MFQLVSSQLLFYGGIGMMIIAVILALLFVVIFMLTGKSINSKLEQEYGKIQSRSSKKSKGV